MKSTISKTNTENGNFETLKYTYNEKINTIHNYFGVSTNAAKYIFSRRRHGFPWKKVTDEKYLKWDIQIQNAFVEADTIKNFNWGNMQFDNDIQILLENGIKIENQSKTVNKNHKSAIKKIDDEWTVVTTDKKKLNEKHILKFIGLLPIVSKE
jgi:hypothetical protein